MEYGLAKPEDLQSIGAFLERGGHFVQVETGDIGGHWIVAKHGKEIKGSVWFFAECPNMFVDYWQADNPRVAARLLYLLEAWAKQNNVRFVHGEIHVLNPGALRMAVEGFNTLAGGFYHRIYKDLHGSQKD